MSTARSPLHKPGENIARDPRNRRIDEKAGWIRDRPDGKYGSSSVRLIEHHFRSAVIWIQALGEELRAWWRRRTHFVRFVTRRSAGTSLVQTRFAEDVTVAQTRSIEN